ncbi:hypothetical protein C8J56DRAFT_923257 [Mycena floridula]|nr:hypothetical protein C8J56DRAFT_923257 [Mycena floridula]
MILDEKCFLNPPPYYTPTTPTTRGTTLMSLPAHLVLRIVCDIDDPHFIHTTVRVVNKTLFNLGMHVLRGAFIGSYGRMVRRGYSSDPLTATRELATLDLFIALSTHESHLLDASCLHNSRDEAFRDLFEIMQPKTRLEDLVEREMQEIRDQKSPYINSPAPSVETIIVPQRKKSWWKAWGKRSETAVMSSQQGSTVTLATPKKAPLPPFSSLSIKFEPRSVSVLMVDESDSQSSYVDSRSSYYADPSSYYDCPSSSSSSSVVRTRTLVTVPRSRQESLEDCALRIVQAMQDM